MNSLDLCVEGLSVTVGPAEAAKRLDNLNFHLPPAGITLLIGHTGSGKSTLLHVLAGLEPPSAGDVTYGKTPLWMRDRPNPTLLRKLGIVFQHPEHQLFAHTVEREFTYSLKPYKRTPAVDEERVRSALAAVSLNTTILNQFPLTLSGGQKRRVAIATTLATEPAWLFLDEPTAGLDPKASVQLIATLKDYAAKRDGAVLVATHDLNDFLPIANMVLILNQGKLLAQTTPEQLIHTPWVLEASGIGLPSFLSLHRKLVEAGLPLSSPSLSMKHMTDKLVEVVAVKRNEPIHPERNQSTANLGAMGNTGYNAVDGLPDNSPYPVTEDQALPVLDVRAKWLFYILTSLGILLQVHVTGLLTASAMTLATALLTHLNIRRMGRILRPFLYLATLSVLLSGLRFSSGHGLWHSGITFSAASAFFTFGQMWKLWLLVMMGAWFTSSCSQLEIKQALEQLLFGLAKLGVPVRAFALGTSLLLRFIPVLDREQRRFARITQARGKSAGKPGRLRLRDLPAFVIPLILALFQLGEDLALAMEARGCAHVTNRTHPVALPKLSLQDWGLITLAVALLVLLWAFHSSTLV